MLFTYKKSKNTSRVLAVVVISAIAIGIISTVIQPFVANAILANAGNGGFAGSGGSSGAGTSTGGNSGSNLFPSTVSTIPSFGDLSGGNGGSARSSTGDANGGHGGHGGDAIILCLISACK